jgi:hypothetical protein
MKSQECWTKELEVQCPAFLPQKGYHRMLEEQTWVMTTYYDLAQAAQPHPRATVLAGFEQGQDAYWSQDGDPHQKAGKTVVLEMLDDAMQQDARFRISEPHPAFAVGSIAGYVHAYLQATAVVADRSTLPSPDQHHWERPPRPWLTVAYKEIALALLQDEESIESTSEEGQDLWYTAQFDGLYPKTEHELTVEMPTLFDEAMRADPRPPASPNGAVGFLAGSVQASVETEQQQKTQPPPLLAEEVAK